MFGLEPPFSTRTKHSAQIVKLLKVVTLGSNGARYKHRGIEKRIELLYKPLYVNLSIREKLIANVTFCRRDKDWYVRYFAFDQVFQSAKQGKSRPNKRGKIKAKLRSFFENALEDPEGPDQFYAFIDPKNERSQLFSESLGFSPVATIATQTFSRLKPKNQNIEKLHDKNQVKELITNEFSERPLFHPYQSYNETPFYVLKEKGEIIAFAKSHDAEWEIEQLPGKYGNVLTRIVPFIPMINKIIRPNSHKFTAIDSVWVKDHNSKYFEQLAEGILASEKHNVIHWWVDKQDETWKGLSKSVGWGLLQKINGVHDVNLVTKSKEKKKLKGPAYISGFDFI
jgi:hypothetical protein